MYQTTGKLITHSLVLDFYCANANVFAYEDVLVISRVELTGGLTLIGAAADEIADHEADAGPYWRLALLPTRRESWCTLSRNFSS
jgi:hypothetical protein